MLFHKLDLLEKSNKRQLINEIKKKEVIRFQLRNANDKIASLQNITKVSNGHFSILYILIYQFLSKEQEIQVKHLKSLSTKGKTKKSIKHSISTGNMNRFETGKQVLPNLKFLNKQELEILR